MVPQKQAPVVFLPEIELGTLIMSGKKEIITKQDQSLIAAAVTETPEELLPAGVRRVRIYGKAITGKNSCHDDQLYTASCSFKDDGPYEAPWVLAVCHNKTDGWYIVPIAVR